jgi:hypothetical protein
VNQVFGQTQDETEVCDTVVAEGKMKFFLCNVIITQLRDPDHTSKFSYTRELKTKKLMFNIDNGEKIYVFASSIAPYFKQVKAAKKEFNKFKLKKAGGLTVCILGLFSGFVTTIFAVYEGNTGLAVGSAIGGLAVGWGGVLITRSSYNNLLEGVKKYNEGMKLTSQHNFSLKPDYLVLGNAQGTAGVSIGWYLRR